MGRLYVAIAYQINGNGTTLRWVCGMARETGGAGARASMAGGGCGSRAGAANVQRALQVRHARARRGER